MNPARKIFIEAVTVCVNYADFLAETLPHNLPHVDRMVVVTTPADWATRNLCRRLGVDCVATETFFRDDPAKMNKSRGINLGLAHLVCRDWLLHIDADMALPPTARKLIANADLDEGSIYGVDRADCRGAAAWDAHLASGSLQFENGIFVHQPRGMPIVTRYINPDYGGFVPVGAFQLWHSSRQTRYPILPDGAMEHTDILHAIRWERPKRALLPEIIAIHLDSSSPGTPMGVNWSGRKSPAFRPSQPAEVAVNYGPR